MGSIGETAGFPQIYNIEADPKEQVNIAHTGIGWVMGPYLKLVNQYKASLKEHPNPPAGNVTKYLI
jgi:arylsulfatase